MKCVITSEAHMREFGQAIGSRLGGGEFIELAGDVGAGKTTFTKGLAVGMGITETIQSPTFTISREYDAPNGLHLRHYDFYRLGDAGIMADELAEASSIGKSVVVVEWGDVVKEVMPRDYLQITFSSTSETARSLNLQAHGEKAKQLVAGIAA